jgi:microcystin-dependent protein
MESYIGTVQTFAFDFAPRGWAACQGQILSTAQYTALYALIGNIYGGSGTTTMGLPNLSGRAMMSQNEHPGSDNPTGATRGRQTVSLTEANLPPHTHGLMVANTNATGNTPAGDAVLAAANGFDGGGNAVVVHTYGPSQAGTPMSGAAIGIAGGSQPVSLLQPYIVANHCICLNGLFPSRP